MWLCAFLSQLISKKYIHFDNLVNSSRCAGLKNEGMELLHSSISGPAIENNSLFTTLMKCTKRCPMKRWQTNRTSSIKTMKPSKLSWSSGIFRRWKINFLTWARHAKIWRTYFCMEIFFFLKHQSVTNFSDLCATMMTFVFWPRGR